MTTHATMLGRAMSGSGVDIYERLDEIEPSQEAIKLASRRKHSHGIGIGREATASPPFQHHPPRGTNLLGTNPDVVTVNGFNLEGFAEPATVAKTRTKSRKALIDLASRFLERDLDPKRLCW